MSNPIINPQQPNYSGVTIQISNPAVYAGGNSAANPIPSQRRDLGALENIGGETNPEIVSRLSNPYYTYNTNPQQAPAVPPQYSPQAYPPQYYLNNYNYQNNGTTPSKNAKNVLNEGFIPVEENVQGQQAVSESTAALNNSPKLTTSDEEPQDFTKSNAVIEDLNKRAAEDAAAKKNMTKKRVVALTDEYIKSLENYLNNPNDEIRLMASKEILTRLDEDKDRYDDAALNALLNKMLQDPSKLVRVASLSALASGLASGNDYTVKLLHDIQQNPDADKEDVLQAADILLKMSAGTELKEVPYQNKNKVVEKTTEKGSN